MRAPLFRVLTLFGVLLAPALPAIAHHSVQAEFDQDKKIRITGVLTKVLWVSPHVRWVLEVKDPRTGKVQTWDVSGGGPGGFRAMGISGRDVFKVGQTYTALIALARDGSNFGHAYAFILPDGRKIDLWQSYKE